MQVHYPATRPEFPGKLTSGQNLLTWETQAVSAIWPSEDRYDQREPSHQPRNYFAAMRTDRFFLPFALLRLMTSRPFLVAILTRKPWVLLRETLLGWNVLFMWRTSGIFIRKRVFTHTTPLLSRYLLWINPIRWIDLPWKKTSALVTFTAWNISTISNIWF